ncbi:hypothetical protein ASG25_19425 [Rhizobium sp. Leaf384]|uniref:tetratricopeptide repeat protein n=1 Tax=unclassified Rhizobium TaxID=2613769 RepID=UPI0007140BEB|nr:MULTISPECIES: tetratricopeptide repeat protein [unclassified Rhizobium]KQS75543.1 hypothetical protein ASG25_19425 [Rhizobium sp. Leaf384]KQS75792.1 hypothetical protein ASG58_13105 [Rhizobium sp. Leaf383]
MTTARILLFSTLVAATATATYYGSVFWPKAELSTGSIVAPPAVDETGNRLSLVPPTPAARRNEPRPADLLQDLPPAAALPKTETDAKPETGSDTQTGAETKTEGEGEAGTAAETRDAAAEASVDGPVDKKPQAAPDATVKPETVIKAQVQPQTPAKSPEGAPATAAAPAAATPAKPSVDEGALRYFARQGDTVRLQAEIARLRTLYPDWEPPADPLAAPPNADTQLEAMWALYAETRYADVRKAIADRQAREPGWQPPENLLAMLALGEARQRLLNASNLQQYPIVVDVAAEMPQLLVCSEIDILWRLAEAFAKTDRAQRAVDAYTYILSSCTESADRLATVQKAASLLPRPLVEQLLTQEKTDPTGKGEFEPVKDDLARQFVASAGEDPKLVVPPTYLSRLEHAAETGGKASDALLLGWYYLRRNATEQAETWFRKARTAEDSATASQGLALTLVARKTPGEAEAVLYPWRDTSDDTRATYLAAAANLLALDPPVVIEADVLQRIAQEAMRARSADVAQQFGWYARAFEQPQLALQWFSTSLTWAPETEPSAYGLAITANQLGMARDVARIQRQWAGRSPRIALLGEQQDDVETARRLPAATVADDAPRQPARQSARASSGEASTQVSVEPAAPPRQRPARSGAARRNVASASGRGCSTSTDPSGLSAGEALRHGWCLMELNRPLEAARHFDAAIRGGDTRIRSEAAYGQSLAYLRQGLTDKASVAATRGSMDAGKATEIQIALLTNRALAAFDQKRFSEALILLERRAQLAPERVDLMVLRGYALLGLKRFGEAIRTFEALAATGNQDAIRGLANARAATPAAVSSRH